MQEKARLDILKREAEYKEQERLRKQAEREQGRVEEGAGATRPRNRPVLPRSRRDRPAILEKHEIRKAE